MARQRRSIVLARLSISAIEARGRSSDRPSPAPFTLHGFVARTPSGYGRIQACPQHLVGPRCNSRSVDVGEPRTRAPSRRVNSRRDVRRTIYVTARSALTPCG
jgi:hypothetical protein